MGSIIGGYNFSDGRPGGYTGLEIVSVSGTGSLDGSLIDAAGNHFPIHGKYDATNVQKPITFNDAAFDGLVLTTSFYSGNVAFQDNGDVLWIVGGYTEQGLSFSSRKFVGITHQHGGWWAGDWYPLLDDRIRKILSEDGPFL